MFGSSLDFKRADAKSDIKDVCELGELIWKEYFPEKNVISIDQVGYMLNKYYNEPYIEQSIEKGEIFYKLVEGREDVGFFSYIIDKQTPALNLKKAFLKRSWRRKGIFSKKILPFVVSVSRTSGIEVIKLAVNRNNKEAIATYKSCNFTVTKSIDVQIGSGFVMNDILMEKHLSRDS